VIAVRTVVAGGAFVSPSIRRKLRDLQCHGRVSIQQS
jgi:DNA-binding NarL/FixJ family response regulator